MYDTYYCMAATRDHSLERIWVILNLPNKIWKISIPKILTQTLKPLQPFKDSLRVIVLECLWHNDTLSSLIEFIEFKILNAVHIKWKI